MPIKNLANVVLFFGPSAVKNKKYTIKFNNNGKNKTVNFGDKRYEDYTTHKDDKRKANYLSRHSKEPWTDPTKPGTLSRYILWNKSSLSESFADYKQRFKLIS